MTTARWVRTLPKRISDVKPGSEWQCGAPHSGGGIEGSTEMDSDQTAAEALQEAETEVGTA
jgi:hypothetical protein